MDVTYKSRHIRSVTELHLETDCWIPIAGVSWEQGGTQYRQLLTGPIGYFKTIEESYALEMAETWIDAEPSDDLTP